MARRSIDIEGFGHLNPIPAASRVGPMVMSSVISPYEKGSRELPPTLEAQVENLFSHVGAILDAAGATWDDMVKMTFYVSELAARAVINGPWVARFPDPESRPARHTIVLPADDPNVLVRGEFVAYVERRG